MLKSLFLITESYLTTLLLHLAHGNSIMSAHTWLVAIPGALIFLLTGGGFALVVYGITRIYRCEANAPFISWVIAIAIVGMALIIGARPDS
jgi:hypothetical protein